MSAAATPAGKRVLCLGDALVDLICERPVAELAAAEAFVPHFGGTVANIAVHIARAGAPVTLAGGAGGDSWGRWLRTRLGQEGVDTSLFVAPEGRQTAVAHVTVTPDGEAAYHVYGAGPGLVQAAIGARIEDEVRAAAGLVISSNTLVDEEERELTMRARAAALAAGCAVLFDPNLRLHRWRSVSDAAASANACVPGALLVRCNRDEAMVMTGEDDPERAAVALVKAGAQLVVITLGADGAMLRGKLRADVPAVGAAVRSTVGAGDALTGRLVGRLAASGFYPAAVAAGLREAVALAAEACERWGALD